MNQNQNNFEVIVCRMLKGDNELRASVVEVSPEGIPINEAHFIQAKTPEDLAEGIYISGALDRKSYRTKNEGIRIKKNKITSKIMISKSSCGKMGRYQFDNFTNTLREKMKLIPTEA